jgi:hypothetical protein
LSCDSRIHFIFHCLQPSTQFYRTNYQPHLQTITKFWSMPFTSTWTNQAHKRLNGGAPHLHCVPELAVRWHTEGFPIRLGIRPFVSDGFYTGVITRAR